MLGSAVSLVLPCTYVCSMLINLVIISYSGHSRTLKHVYISQRHESVGCGCYLYYNTQKLHWECLLLWCIGNLSKMLLLNFQMVIKPTFVVLPNNLIKQLKKHSLAKVTISLAKHYLLEVRLPKPKPETDQNPAQQSPQITVNFL